MRLPKTGVKEDVLDHIGQTFGSPPPGDFTIHAGRG